MQRQTAVLMLVGAALFWSTGGILIKWVDWHPLAISGMRSAIGAAVLFAVFRPRRFTWSWLQLGAAVAYAATVTLFVVANKTTTAANAILLQYTAPVHVALFGAWFLGEKPRRLDWIALTLVLGGMVLFFLEDLSMTGLWGNLAALASGLSFAWLALFLRRQKEGSPVEAILFGNLLAALIGLPFMLQSSPTDAGWLGLTLLGVFQVGLPYALFARAIREVTAMEAMLIPTIEPVLNPLWVLLLLGEAPGRLALGGGAIILTAVTGRGLLPLLERRRRPRALG
jgi:drug/metabolite transporter (DMT)-like permease